MAQTLLEFLKHREDHEPKSEDVCGECNKPISYEEVQCGDVEYTSNGIAHSDCYYEGIGKLIDEHPLGGLGIHGPKTGIFD